MLVGGCFLVPCFPSLGAVGFIHLPNVALCPTGVRPVFPSAATSLTLSLAVHMRTTVPSFSLSGPKYLCERQVPGAEIRVLGARAFALNYVVEGTAGAEFRHLLQWQR